MENTRRYWVDTMLKITAPVIEALAEERLKKDMSVVSSFPKEKAAQWVYLEALGRVSMGIAPWLACKGLEGEEEALRQKYFDLMCKAITNAVNPDSPDYIDFTPAPNMQPIVDAAFLAEGLLRAPELYNALDDKTKKHLVLEMKKIRQKKSPKNNWLLFAATVEAFLHMAGEEDWHNMRIDYALEKHMNYYFGDARYGDGPRFHLDYYNSFVIHPMLVDVLNEVGDEYPDWATLKPTVLTRASRYATYLEHMISPEGTFPPLGRSLCYRFGAFHALSQMALLHQLEESISPAQVRCALTSVIERIMSFDGMFDEKGWLQSGLCGHQPGMSEPYITTGSLYLCSAVFLPLGLEPKDPFWSDADADWTAKQFWNGNPDRKCEHSIG